MNQVAPPGPGPPGPPYPPATPNSFENGFERSFASPAFPLKRGLIGAKGGG